MSNNKISSAEKAKYLDFLYTFNEHLDLFDKKNHIKLEILKPYAYRPEKDPTELYFHKDHTHSEFNPLKQICLALNPYMTVKEFDAISDASRFSVDSEIEHGYYENDVSVKLELSFHLFSLFKALDERSLLDNKLKSLLQTQLKHEENKRYEVVPKKLWVNKASGKTASVHGAVPYTSKEDEKNWELQDYGFTIHDKKDNTYGLASMPKGKVSFNVARECAKVANENHEAFSKKLKEKNKKKSVYIKVK
jgi:hypothetical protein